MKTRKTEQFTDSNTTRSNARWEIAEKTRYYGTVYSVRVASESHKQTIVNAQMRATEKWFNRERFSEFISSNSAYDVLHYVYSDDDLIFKIYEIAKESNTTLLAASIDDERNTLHRLSSKFYILTVTELALETLGLDYHIKVTGKGNKKVYSIVLD